jgi:hypothetical protein
LRGRWPVAGPTSRSSLAALVAAGIFTASCGVASSSRGGLPTHNDLNAYPMALLAATLVRDGECVVVQRADPSGRWLPIWPSGFSLNGDAVMNGSVQVAKVGESVKLVGGEYHESQYDFLFTIMPVDVPADCRGGEYWLVGQVVP